MVAAVERALEFGQQGGRALLKRAVLWETAKTGEPVETQRPLPPAVAWIKDGTATHTSTFHLDGDVTHRIFTLFESDVEPKGGDPAFVSGLTGSGLPRPRRTGPPVSLAWILGILAAVLLFWMLASLTGHSVKQARDPMAGTLPVLTGAYLEQLDAGCKANGSVCKDAFDAGATPPQTDRAAAATAACIKPPASGDSALHTSAFCRYPWSLALTAANAGHLTGGAFVSVVLGWPVGISQRTGALSLEKTAASRC
jgi:hypothetical protein